MNQHTVLSEKGLVNKCNELNAEESRKGKKINKKNNLYSLFTLHL